MHPGDPPIVATRGNLSRLQRQRQGLGAAPPPGSRRARSDLRRDIALSIEFAAQAQLYEIQRDLEAIRYRLIGVHATLPAAAAEIVQHLEIEGEMVISTHLRAIIETLLEDKIDPALRDLRDASELVEKP